MRKKEEKHEFTPDIYIGLTASEIDYQKRTGSVNSINDTNGKSYCKIIISNVFTFFNILMLIIAACELVFCGFNMIPNMGFLMLVIINTLVGSIQECHSKRELDRLRILNSSKITVIRDGNETEILPNEIVLSDIVKCKIGDQIPADMIIKEIYNSNTIDVNESLLTGESAAVKKHVGDMLLAGSYIISGTCVCLTKKVGSETYLYSIESKAKGFKKPESKLILSIRRIIKILASVAIPLAGIVFWNNLMTDISNGKTQVYFIWDSFGKGTLFMEQSVLYNAVKWAGMAVAYMIPAGMILLASVAMATGAISLANKKVLIRDLYSVESLSRVDTLCFDKTGTITDGTMAVSKDILLDDKYSLNDELYKIISSYLSAFNEENQTSKAMVEKYGKTQVYKVLDSLPFSSERKYSAVELENFGTFMLGALEYLTSDKDILAQSKEYTKNGLRVILLVHVEIGKIKEDSVSGRRTPVARFVIMDHVRPEANKVIKWFKENDVDIKVISGDNVDTVSYIAKQAGIEGYDRAFDMSKLSENDDIDKIVMNTVIFGRVSPEQKALIVDVLKRNGRTVGMSGDGINDLISLKKSDCSIALSNGAPATKNIANIVLMDSNFENMQNAVLEGRRVVNNIQRSSTLFIMKDVLWFFITIFPILLGIKAVVESTVMSMVNAMITGFASTLLALEPDRARIKGDFTKNVLSRAIVAGCYMFIPILASGVYSFIRCGFTPAVDTSYGLAAVEMLNNMMPVMAICVTIAGFVIFAVTCRPFTKYRKILYFSILAIVVFLLLSMPDLFLINGTQYLAELRARHNNNLWEMLLEIIVGYEYNGVSYGGLFSMNLYKRFILPDPDKWIFILIFFVLSTPLYVFVDKYLTKLLNRTMFNPKRFSDIDTAKENKIDG